MSATPGVSIQELFSLSLSVNSGATAVPVMIGKFNDTDGVPLLVSEGCIKVTDWLDYQSKFKIPDLESIRVVVNSIPPTTIPPIDLIKPATKKSRAKKTQTADGSEDYTYKFTVNAILDSNKLGAFSLRHYFENGGGPCYVLPYSAATDFSNFAAEIQKHPDITLLVLAENDPAAFSIYAALNSLLDKDKGKGYFLIAHGQNTDAPDESLLVGRPSTETNKEQTAYYYPNLGVPYEHPGIAENAMGDIVVEDYVDSEGNAVSNLSDLKTFNEALYTEIIASISQEIAKLRVTLPPSPAVAGAYCRTDRERGVWKAAANIALRSVTSLTDVVSDTRQSDMNLKGINVIRQFSDQGVVIWGARTLVDEATPDWLYVPVRRLFNAAQRDITATMRFAVFEPNSSPTWERVRAAIEIYLYDLWERGALLGLTPEEAYFVQVGKDITMTETDIKQGRMIVKIGMVAVRPAEFIILQFTQEIGQG